MSRHSDVKSFHSSFNKLTNFNQILFHSMALHIFLYNFILLFRTSLSGLVTRIAFSSTWWWSLQTNARGGYFDTDRGHLRRILLTLCSIVRHTTAYCYPIYNVYACAVYTIHFGWIVMCSPQSRRHVKMRSMFSQSFSSVESSVLIVRAPKLEVDLQFWRRTCVHVVVSICGPRSEKCPVVHSLKSKLCQKQKSI